MSTLRVPSSRVINPCIRRSLEFTPAIMRAFARYLESRDGVDAHEFITHDRLPDMAEARQFADELCRQLGRYLDEVVSVERYKNRVLVILRDDWATKA